MPMEPADPVLAALDLQVDGYRRLAKLAEAQHEFVERNQTEDLLDVLGQRQAVLQQIAQLEAVIAPAKGQWAAYLAKLLPPQRGRAEALLAETRRLLEAITTADRNDALVLQQRKLNLGKQINQAQAAKSVNRNYAAAAYGQRQVRVDVQL